MTARMVDTTTGEVLLSAKGEGVSKKGGGFSFGGKSGGGAATARTRATSRRARSARRRKRPARRWWRHRGQEGPPRVARVRRRRRRPRAAPTGGPFFLSIIAAWPRPSSPSPTRSPCSAWGWRRCSSCSCSSARCDGRWSSSSWPASLISWTASSRAWASSDHPRGDARSGGGQDPAHVLLHRAHLGPRSPGAASRAGSRS